MIEHDGGVRIPAAGVLIDGLRVEGVSPDDPRIEVSVDGRRAARVAELLELLSELPSTPTLIAEEARHRASELAWALPEPVLRRGAGARQPRGPVVLDVLSTTGLAGLLELLAGMPSTPPEVAADARDCAEWLWERLPGQRDPADWPLP